MITLIRAPTLGNKNNWMQSSLPPLGLAYLAASLKQAGFNPRVIDAVGEGIEQFCLFEKVPETMRHGLSNQEIISRIPLDEKIIGVSCMFSQDWTLCRDLITDIKKQFPNTYIVAGGEHITSMYEYSLSDCPSLDCCVLGEGEETIVELVEAKRGSKVLENIQGITYRVSEGIRVNPRRARIKGISEIPWPEWGLFPLKAYFDAGMQFGVGSGISMPVLASRGCPYLCTFCSSPQMWGTRWEPRLPEELLDEIEFYMDQYNAVNFDFFDLTAIIKKDWIVAFSKLIFQRGLKINYELPVGTRSEALDDESLGLLYESGCNHIGYAPESWSDETLKLIKKKIKKERMFKSINSALEKKMVVKASFVVGFPHESVRHLLANVPILIRLAFIGTHGVAINLFSPYPGSELFESLKKEGKLIVSDNYFHSLVSSCGLGASLSYSDHFSNKKLGIYSLSLLALFYSLSFLFRPNRFTSMLLSLINNKPTNRFEKALGKLKMKRLLFRKTLSPSLHVNT